MHTSMLWGIEPLKYAYIRERGELPNMIPLIIQIRLARTQRKKGANPKF